LVKFSNFYERKVKTILATMTTKTMCLRRTRHNFVFKLLAKKTFPTVKYPKRTSRRNQKSVGRLSPIARTLPCSSMPKECARSATTRLVELRHLLTVPIRKDQATQEGFASCAISKSTIRAGSRLDHTTEVFKVDKYI